jgi:enoyl-CoA hydratase
MAAVEVVTEDWGTRITLNQPPVNAMTDELMMALEDALIALTGDSPPVCVLTGAGRCFCAGADLKTPNHSADDLTVRLRRGRRVNGLLREMPCPVIAAVNGACRGGGMNMIASCDIRIAVDSATFGIPEVARGRAGGAALLRGLVPEGTLRWLALTGEPMTAADAFGCGFVQKVISAEEWMSGVDHTASMIASHGSGALSAIKESLTQSRQASVSEAQWVEQQVTFRLWAAGERKPWEAS